MIEFKNVSYHYGKGENQISALRDINLVINEGEFVAVLGPNGSGKSTLARHVNGLLKPTCGEVKVDGLSTDDPRAIWEIRQRVGMVFQNPDNQIVASSVKEDVSFGPENLGISTDEIKLRVNSALKTVGMTDFSSIDPHMLSGGQKQKVAIAGALAMNPKYIVLDEATSMLDPKGRADIISTIEKLNREYGITILYITHIPDEAVLADRIIILSNGSIAMDGSPRDVFSNLSALSKIGVGAPAARLIAEELLIAGVNLPNTILTVDELVAALC
ncbi:MAG: energy-coupling factor transporter ATPase [Actinomycetota bacterium]